MSARLEALASGGFVLRGELNFDSVAALYPQSARLFGEVGTVRVDLSGVTRSDSSGVALLVDWLSRAKAGGRGLELVDMPAQMRSIIQVADLEGVLPVGEGASGPPQPGPPPEPHTA